MRRTISSRWETTAASRTVTRSSISSADSAWDTSSRRGLYPSRRGHASLAPRRVGPREELAGALQHVAAVVDVEAHDAHRLRHRDHRVAGLLGDPLRGAVPG